MQLGVAQLVADVAEPLGRRHLTGPLERTLGHVQQRRERAHLGRLWCHGGAASYAAATFNLVVGVRSLMNVEMRGIGLCSNWSRR